MLIRRFASLASSRSERPTIAGVRRRVPGCREAISQEHALARVSVLLGLAVEVDVGLVGNDSGIFRLWHRGRGHHPALGDKLSRIHCDLFEGA